MAPVALVELLAGAALVALVLYDVFQSVVVPRYTTRALRLAPAFLDGFWDCWRWLGRRMKPGEQREDFLGAFAPLSILLTLILWTLALILGYGLVLHGLQDQVRPPVSDPASALYLAAVSLFTIGYGDFVPVGLAARITALAAGASGLAVVALVLSLLFNLHASFQRREVQVLVLEGRAGTPPSGVTLLETYASLGMLSDLPGLFATWETWAAEVLESHRAYPILPFFRSSHEGQSWVSALGAILDAATLLLTTVEGPARGPAEMLHRMGVHTLADLNVWCGLKCGPEVGVERADWEAARQRLASVGFQVRDSEEAWRSFRRARSDYGGPLNSMARHLLIPPAAWIGDRPLGHHLTRPQAEAEGRPAPAPAGCTHLDQIQKVTPGARGCEECLRTGDRWVHLRLCLVCGRATSTLLRTSTRPATR